MPLPDRIPAGRPWPLGATLTEDGVNFALFSAHAERVELCLFDAEGRQEVARRDLPACTDQVWHGFLPGAGAGTVYGYRVHGPYAPLDGHRFNPNKLLLDPYARGLAGGFRWDDSVHGYTRGDPAADLSFDPRDSAAFVPKSVVIDPAHDWEGDEAPRTPWSDTVIYEAHVRGLTMRHPGVPEPLRGTLGGLAHPVMVDHLRRLGVTAVELMPVHAFLDERALVERGLKNYWGYNTTAFFAVHPAYAGALPPLEALRNAVKALHRAGIEVILDVVYNHTAESDVFGPTLNFRGIDNLSYYQHTAHDRREPFNPTGTGNALDLGHPRVLQMVMDSLRWWVEAAHVDGFRFDLATTLARVECDFTPAAPFLQAVAQDPVLAQAKLIAEPWDIGPGGWRVGGFPAGWSEWNDHYRDGIRRSWRGDPGSRPELARRLSASADLFDHDGRGARASVNFVTAHDGFTLADLVSYAQKHNEANGEGNRDGTGDNHSDNLGAEGPDRRPGDPGPAGAAAAQPAGDAAVQPGRADAAGRRRAGPQPAGQQQRLLPGRAADLAGLGRGRPRLPRFRRPDRGAAPDPSGPAPAALPARRPGREGRPARHRLAAAGRPADGSGRLGRPGRRRPRRAAERAECAAAAAAAQPRAGGDGLRLAASRCLASVARHRSDAERAAAGSGGLSAGGGKPGAAGARRRLASRDQE